MWAPVYWGLGWRSCSPEPYAVPLLLLGLLGHGWGMYAKHRLEVAEGVTLPRWAAWLYWGCWVLLVAAVLYLALVS